jgi:4-hydroxy-tetrahydrodipicolinate reductase
MTKKIRLAISGCAGRMGSTIWELASHDPDFEVVVALEKQGHPLVGKEKNGVVITDNLTDLRKADVLIEFSTPEATMDHVWYVLKQGYSVLMAMVIGTTGLKDKEITIVKETSKRIPILFSPNMSFGANYVLKLARQMARELGSDWDIEGIEIHRKGKADTPSGTAKKGARLIQEETGREIPFHALRIGSVPGKHMFFFACQGEVITLSHEAESPVLFAKGALVLTKKLVNQPPSLYEPVDLL